MMPDPVLFRLPGLPPVQRALYAAATFAEIRTLPWRDATPNRGFVPARFFAATIDLRDFAFDPGFRGVAMIDYFLAHLGIDPGTVPPAVKRNTWLARHVSPGPPPAAPGYALLCAGSSMKLRNMPHAIARHLANRLREAGWRVRVPRRARSLAALCAQIAHAGFVVSTDTAMVHLADAFSVPCMAFFPTHRPEWRVRDYPFCHPIHLPAPGLPEALEFARGPTDLAATRQAWFPHGRDLAWLDGALASVPRGLSPESPHVRPDRA